MKCILAWFTFELKMTLKFSFSKCSFVFILYFNIFSQNIKGKNVIIITNFR